MYTAISGFLRNQLAKARPHSYIDGFADRKVASRAKGTPLRSDSSSSSAGAAAA
jgi:hypothetical protein